MTQIECGPAVTRIAGGAELPAPGRWQIDPGHTELAFIGRHFMLTKVRGRFTGLSGVIEVAEAPGDSTVAVTIDMTTLESGNAARDEHLRSADFFDVEQFPELRFLSKRIETKGEGRYRVVGDLTIHGVTREVALDAEYGGRATDPWGHDRLGFLAKASIDRRDFGLTWNQVVETGGVVVGERVEIELDVEAVRMAAQSAA